MSSEELNDLAGALRQLQPSVAALNRDRLMFQGGRASVRRGWAWPLATAVSSLLNLGLGLALLLQPAPRQLVENPPQVVPQPEEPPATPATPDLPPLAYSPDSPDWNDTAYHRLQEQLSRWGLDAVPTPPPAGPERPPMTVDALFKELDPSSTTAPSAKEDP